MKKIKRLRNFCINTTGILFLGMMFGCSGDDPADNSEQTKATPDIHKKTTAILDTSPAVKSEKEISNVQQQPDTEVTGYGMSSDLNRFSSLKQINKTSVKRLVPVWNFTLGDNRGQETQPLIKDGVIYVTTHNATFAIDARTGQQKWKTAADYPKETLACCGIVNRGGAIKGNAIVRTTLDGYVVSLDLETGKENWRSKSAEMSDGFSITVAPLIAGNVVITGVSGGEFGTRGYIDGWNFDDGEHLWRFYTIPSPDQPGGDTWPGDTWKHGGGPTWLTGSYDPELDLVYWGVGNAGPWNARIRPGDNLYTNSMLALRPKTGELIWHYQFTPNDPFDYDGVNSPVLIEKEIDGKMRKLLIQANRNGYFYVLDRETGKLLQANPFIEKITWADGINMETGRPILSDTTKKMLETGEKVEIWPSAFGGNNMAAMSYNPLTELAYANTIDMGWNYTPVEPKYRYGVFYIGMKFEWLLPKNGPAGYLKAIEPLTGKTKWQFPTDVPMNGGTLSTAGQLVFTGAQTGEFYAFDAENGDKLWQFKTGSGIIAPPITYSLDGKQYVVVASGLGGAYALIIGDERLANVNQGGSIWAFALMDQEGGQEFVAPKMKAAAPVELSKPAVPAAPVTTEDGTASQESTETLPVNDARAKQISSGDNLYHALCSHCHGANMKSSGAAAFDLRNYPADEKERFFNSVLNGKGNMPAWAGKIEENELEDVFVYVTQSK
ncbi:MAG: PQQ-dependent dehydrogenase, methanol/ethanol family [Methylococcales bacterium]